MKKFFAVILILSMVVSLCACDSSDYKEALEFYKDEMYKQARDIFVELGDYEDSAQMVNACDYQIAMEHMEDKKYDQAREIFVGLGDYEDSAQMVNACDYEIAMEYMDYGDFEQARTIFEELAGYKNSVQLATECNYNLAMYSFEKGNYTQAHELFVQLGDYEDSQELVGKAARSMVVDYLKTNTVADKTESSGAIIGIRETDGNIWVGYVWEMTGIINMGLNVGATIYIDGDCLAICAWCYIYIRVRFWTSI